MTNAQDNQGRSVGLVIHRLHKTGISRRVYCQQNFLNTTRKTGLSQKSLTPDLRGAGWTVAEDPHIACETRLADLLHLFELLDIQQAHLMSHDMGALTAIQLTYEHPDRVRTAVQLSVFPAFATFHPKLAPAFQHLPGFIWHRRGASLRDTFTGRYVSHPMSQDTIDGYLAPLHRPDIDAAVRTLTRKMILPEALRITRGVYRRRYLTVPTLIMYGRNDHPTTEELMQRITRHPERFATGMEFSYIDDAAHFLTDDTPADAAKLALDWFQRIPVTSS